MPDLVSRLRVEMTEGVTGTAKKAAHGLQTLEDKLRAVRSRVGAFKDFKMKMVDVRDLNRQVGEMRSAMKQIVAARDAAFAKLNSFGSGRITKNNPLFEQARAAKAEYQKLVNEQKRLEGALKRTEGAYSAHKAAAKQMGDAINGIRYDKLINEEQRLIDKIAQTDAAIKKRSTGQPGGPSSGPADVVPGRKVPGGKVKGEKVGDRLKQGVAAASGAVAGFNFWGMVRDGTMYGYDAQVESNKMMSQGGVDQDTARALAEYAREYSLDKGFTDPIQGMQVINEGLKSGLAPDAAKALLKHSGNLSTFGDMNPMDAAKAIINTAFSFQKKFKTAEDVDGTAQDISDKIATLANQLQVDTADLLNPIMQNAPVAAGLGMSLDQLLALLGTQIKDGVSPALAGTATRSMLLGSVKPTIGARQTMANLGLNPLDFATEMREWDPADAVSGMEHRFGKLPDGTREKFQALMEASIGKPLEDIQDIMAEFFIDATKADTAQDKEKVVDASRKFLEQQVQEMDMEALLVALQGKKITNAQVASLFNAKHGSRLYTALRDGDYQTMLELLNGTEPGHAGRQAEKQNANGVGTVRKTANWFKAGISRDVEQGMGALPEFRPEPGPTRAPVFYGGGKSGGGKAMVRGVSSPSPMGTAIGGFDVKADTTAAESALESVKTKMTEIDGKTVTTSMALTGAASALSLLEQIAKLISQINSSSVSPPGMRAVHADVGGGRGW